MYFLKCTLRAVLCIVLNDVSEETLSTLVKAVSAVLNSFAPKRHPRKSPGRKKSQITLNSFALVVSTPGTERKACLCL